MLGGQNQLCKFPENFTLANKTILVDQKKQRNDITMRANLCHCRKLARNQITFGTKGPYPKEENIFWNPRQLGNNFLST